jgi:hypothetical protein
MITPTIQMMQSWRVAHKRPGRTSASYSNNFSTIEDTPILSQAMNAMSAPPTLPIWTIAVMFPILFAS